MSFFVNSTIAPGAQTQAFNGSVRKVLFFEKADHPIHPCCFCLATSGRQRLRIHPDAKDALRFLRLSLSPKAANNPAKLTKKYL
jgi:hypothetical protein